MADFPRLVLLLFYSFIKEKQGERSISHAIEHTKYRAYQRLRIDNLMAPMAIRRSWTRSLPWPRPLPMTFPLRHAATSDPCLHPTDGSSRGRSDCDRRAADTYRWWDRAGDLCCNRSGTCAVASRDTHIHAYTVLLLTSRRLWYLSFFAGW